MKIKLHRPRKQAASHMLHFQCITKCLRKDSERFRVEKSDIDRPPLVIGGRLYKYRTHAIRDLSITDEELAMLVEWVDANPTTRISKTGKKIYRFSTFHYRTAWKHPNAGPKTFAALQKSVYWPARCVGYCHHKFLRSKEAFVVSLTAMMNEETKRVRHYMSRVLCQPMYYIDKCNREYDEAFFEHKVLCGPPPSMEKLVEKTLYPTVRYGGMSVEEYLKKKPWEVKSPKEDEKYSSEAFEEDLDLGNQYTIPF